MMSAVFARDDAWQARIAARFLDPLYELCGWRVNRYPGDHEQQRKHVDVLLTREREQLRVDEKIIRGRRDGLPATKISFETMSCTQPGAEAPGWGAQDVQNDAAILHVCFADTPDLDEQSWTRVQSLDCVWIPFQPLRKWFWRMDGERRWERQHNGQANGSISHKVPIDEILSELRTAERFTVPASIVDAFKRIQALRRELDAALEALEAELPPRFEWLPDKLMDEIIAQKRARYGRSQHDNQRAC
jgi:hypothetical protein